MRVVSDPLCLLMLAVLVSILLALPSRVDAEEPELVLVAHRGIVSETLIENSLPALEEAVHRGYTHVEVDVRCTRDGRVVCLHDANLKRTAGLDMQIHEVSLAELRQKVSRELVPSFEEFCARCAGRVGLMPDLKGTPHHLVEAYVDGIKHAMNRHGLMASALFIGPQALLDRFRGAGRICLRVPAAEAERMLADVPDAADTFFVFNHGYDFDQAEVDAFHAMGLPVIVSININHYKEGDPVAHGKRHVEEMLALGVDGLQLDAVYDEPVTVPRNGKPVLRFGQEGGFTIVQFTDTHWHTGGAEDQQSLALMEAVLDAERPDLVVLTGDIVGGSECKEPREGLRRCAAPMVERAIPWAYTFGNHDDECAMTRQEMMNAIRGLPFAVSEPGPGDITGVGNYYLPVYAADSDRPAAYVYCLDSNSYADVEREDYDWIRPDQVEWYRDVARRLRDNNGGEPLPALAFFHIPLPEYNDVWNAGVCVGSKFETVCCPKVNSGLFAALLEAGDVMGTFVGHDHVNDYEGEWHGIRLCYGRASGYTAYGQEGFPRGARVIQLTEGRRSFATWLRLDTGEKLVLSDGQPATGGE